jgi:glycerophosphoryl diester phosphodiesterase
MEAMRAAFHQGVDGMFTDFPQLASLLRDTLIP